MCLKLIAIVSFIRYKNAKKKPFVLHATLVIRTLISLLSRGIQRWGINGRVSPRIFYKLMSMRPAIYPVTPEVPGTMKHAYNLRVRKRHKGATWREDRPSEKKCFRPYVDFLPHCKVTPIHPPLQDGFFIGSMRREFFLAALPSGATPSRLCSGHGGRELWLPRVTSRRFSHLQASPKLSRERNR